MIQEPFTEAEVQAKAERLVVVAASYAGAELPEREPAIHRWLARECARNHPDGYQASNHFRVYLRYNKLVADTNGWPYSED
jgi:hypothetical protein